MTDQPTPNELEVRIGILSYDDVQELVNDVKSAATDVEVRVRSSSESRVPLDRITSLIQSGDIEHAQLRYRFEGRFWIDTLTRTPEGVRLVRTSHSIEDETEVLS